MGFVRTAPALQANWLRSIESTADRYREGLRRSSLLKKEERNKKRNSGKRKRRKAACESSGTIKRRAGYDINDLHRSVLRAVSRAKVSVLVLPVRTRLLHVKTRGANRGVCAHTRQEAHTRARTFRGNGRVDVPARFFSTFFFSPSRRIAIFAARLTPLAGGREITPDVIASKTPLGETGGRLLSFSLARRILFL